MSEPKVSRNPSRAISEGRKAGIVGIATNVLLFAVKLALGLITGSISMISDAINNITDAGSSLLVFVGYVCSAKPADKEHPYGHARMEYLCSLLIAIIVTVLGIELSTTSVDVLIHPGEGHTQEKIGLFSVATARKEATDSAPSVGDQDGAGDHGDHLIKLGFKFLAEDEIARKETDHAADEAADEGHTRADLEARRGIGDEVIGGLKQGGKHKADEDGGNAVEKHEVHKLLVRLLDLRVEKQHQEAAENADGDHHAVHMHVPKKRVW